MSDGIAVRDERPDDAATIAEVTTAAFARAEHSSGDEAAIVDRLRAAGALALSLVALENDAIVGHVAFSPIVVVPQVPAWFGLGPVSVLPGAQRRGIGRALIEHGLERLRAMHANGCVVFGDLAYYERFGFACDAALRYPGAPAEYFGRIVLGAPARGEVFYHSAFG